MGFDSDRLSDSVHIHVYVGGPSGSANAIGYNLRGTRALSLHKRYAICGDQV